MGSSQSGHRANHPRAFKPLQQKARPRPRDLLLRKAIIEPLEIRTLLSTYVVNSLADDGSGGTTNSDGITIVTLRYAIDEADANGGGTVNFDPSVFPPGTSQTIDLFSAALNISLNLNDPDSPVDIDGPGAGALTISGQNTVGGFTVDGTAYISGLTITDGYSNRGGGIDNAGTLTLDNVDVTDSSTYGSSSLTNFQPVKGPPPKTVAYAGDGGGISNLGTLTITNSTISGNNASDDGGGIFNDRTLTLAGSIVSGNTAAQDGGGLWIDSGGTTSVTGSTVTENNAPDGGGIANSGTVALDSSTVSENTSSYDGGGVWNDGTATIDASTVSDNTANTGEFDMYSRGGGVFNAEDGVLVIQESSITGNTAPDGYGGGIANYYDATSTIENSAITGNYALTGGGIHNLAAMTITSCTVANNSATGFGGGIANWNDAFTMIDSTVSGNSTSPTNGAGIYSGDSYADLEGTIVAGNTGDTDLLGGFTGTDNLIGDGSGYWTASSSNNIDGTISNPVDPMLAPLGYYGGPTETMPLLPGSPAINAGMDLVDQNGNPITTDQRGFPMDSGGSDMPDIGAYQVNPITVNTLADDPVDAGQMSFTDATSLANAFGGSQSIGIDPSIITASTDGSTISIGDVLSASLPTSVDEGASDTLTFASGSPLSITAWSIAWGDQDGNALITDTIYNPGGTDTCSDAEVQGLTATASASDGSGNYFTLPVLGTNVELTAPSGLAVSTASPNEIDLSWTNNSLCASDVEILFSTDGTNFTHLYTVGNDVTTYQATGLAPNTAYWFEVTADDENFNESAPSNIESARTAVDPWSVEAVGASTLTENGTYDLSLSVTPTADAPAFGEWTVDWGDGSADSTYTTEDAAATHNFVTGTAFSIIQISASTAFGASSPLTVTAEPIAVDVTPLAPTLLSAVATSQSDIVITWQDNSQCDFSIVLLRSDDGGTTFDPIGTFAPGDGSYDDSELSPSTGYIYELQSAGLDGQDNSPAVSSGTVTTQSPNLGLTVTPGDFGAEGGSATASWTYAGSDVSSWELEQEDATLGENYHLIDSPGVGTQSELLSLTTGDQYNIRLRADYTNGSVSNWELQSITLMPTLFPSVSVAQGSTDYEGAVANFINVSWTLPTLPQGYDPADYSDVSVEYRGTSTAGTGWVKLDDGDAYDGFDFDENISSTLVDIGPGQTATFRVELDGNHGGFTNSSPIQEGGAAGPAPGVNWSWNSDGTLKAAWASAPADGISYRLFYADQSYDGAPQASGAAFGGVDPTFGNNSLSDSFTVQPGDHLSVVVEEMSPNQSGEGESYGFIISNCNVSGTPVPNGPSGAVASWDAPNEQDVFVHWLDNSYDETGYWVYRSTGGSSFNPSTAVPIASLGADATTYDDANADPSQNNFYAIYAYGGSAATAPTSAPTTQPATNPTSQPAIAAAAALTIHVSFTSPLASLLQGTAYNKFIDYLIAGLDSDEWVVRDNCQQWLQYLATINPSLYSQLSALNFDNLTPEQRSRVDAVLLSNPTVGWSIAITPTNDSAEVLVKTTLTAKSGADWHEYYHDGDQGNIDFSESIVNQQNGSDSFVVDSGTTEGATFAFVAHLPSIKVRRTPAKVEITLQRVKVDAQGNDLLNPDGTMQYVTEEIWLYVWVTG